MTLIQNTNTTEQDSFNLDAFGRKRISSTGNRFDIEFIYGKQPLLMDEVTVTGGTVAHNANTRDLTLAIVNTTTATEAAMYSHFYIPYTPGNSQLIEMTGTLDDSDIGGGVAQLFMRTSITGSTAETVYDQSAWLTDTVADADWTKSHILAIDFQSLKVGRIRFALVRDGVAVPIHYIVNDNVRDSGYWQTPTLPVYWRIYNDATYTYSEMGYGDTSNGIGIRYRITKNATQTMRAICATVKSEGGDKLLDMPGVPFSADNGVAPKTVSSTRIPLLSIRPKTTFGGFTNRSLTIPLDFSIQADNPIYFQAWYRPSLTGASFVSADAQSTMEYDVTASAIDTSSAVQVWSGYLATNKNAPAPTDGILGRVIQSLGRTGVSDILTISGTRTTGTNATTYSSISWKEIK